MSPRRVAVVGAGLGGLAVAARLAATGHEVHLFEQQDRPGGKANSLTIDGYRFDTGPSLFTMRPVFEELFEFVGKRLSDALDLVPLDPICSYYYPDGTCLRAWADPERLAEEIGRFTADTPRALQGYLASCRRIYESAGRLFLENDLHAISTYLKPAVVKALLRPWRVDPFRTMNGANSAAFRDRRTIQLFNRYATYNGSDPYRAPATLNIIAYVEHCLGCYGVRGGIYRIVEALEELARSTGVTLHYSSPVEAITVRDRRVSGIRVAGEELPFGVVVSNVDVQVMYNLLRRTAGGRPVALRRWTRRRSRAAARWEPSTSAVVFLWGMKRSHPELGLHTIFFSHDYLREFTDICEGGRTPEDPTIYLHVSSKLTAGDAPAGGENWFILVNAPSHRGQDWERLVDELRVRVRRRIEETLGLSLEGEISCEETITPIDLERRTGSSRGSLYGIASNSRSAAFRRHSNRVAGVAGLYACGGSTHPGGGMPLVLLSAKITAELVERFETRGVGRR